MRRRTCAQACAHTIYLGARERGMYASASSSASAAAPTSSASEQRYSAQGYRLCDDPSLAAASARPRTLLDLARDKSAPNSGNARALVQERGAIFANLALHCECLLTQVGIHVPPATDYSNAAQIRKRLAAPASSDTGIGIGTNVATSDGNGNGDES